MELSRRGFLKLAGLTAASATLADVLKPVGTPEALAKASTDSSRGMLIDITRCIGCGSCEAACQEKNNLHAPANATGLSDQKWTHLQTFTLTKNGETTERYVRTQCFHCEDPACASVCPVGAFRKTPEGPVVYDSKKCIGCRYCMTACPFGIPRYEWGAALPLVRKCQFCYDRITAGEQPACAEACFMGATKFGYRKDLLLEADERIRQNPDGYVNQIYGKTEVGGTSFMFLSDVPFEEIGFRTDVVHEPLPDRTWKIMSKIPGVAVGMGALMTLIYFLSHEAHLVKPEPALKDTHQGAGGGGK